VSARWRATYDDGSHLEEDGRPGGAYAAIERRRLRSFHVFADQYAIAPSFSIDVPQGARLMYRTRHVVTDGVHRALVLIGIEREGQVPEVHVLYDDGRTPQRLAGWGNEEPYTRSVMFLCEV
jgi:hypothetical protein